MREHTITKMRQMLSHQDNTMLSELKEKQRHKFRPLSEARLPFMSGNPSRDKQVVRRAALQAGFKSTNLIRSLADVLTTTPDAILNPSTLAAMGALSRGAISSMLGGGFDPDYRVPEKHGVLSHTASSLERIGGKVGTSVYKTGRTLQKAEKWFVPWDPEMGEEAVGKRAKNYSRGSAFDPQTRGRRDDCVARRISVPGEQPYYVGYQMGTPGYERCMASSESDEYQKVKELKRLLSRRENAEKLPELVRQLGMEPEEYLKHRRADMEYRGRIWRRGAQTQRGQ
jgi:hypothetical protein